MKLGDKHIVSTNLSVRAKNALRDKGIETVIELHDMNDDELKYFRNIGSKTEEIIVKFKNELQASGEIQCRKYLMESDETPVVVLKLSSRVKASLERNNISKMCELLSLMEEEIEGFEKLGLKSVHELLGEAREYVDRRLKSFTADEKSEVDHESVNIIIKPKTIFEVVVGSTEPVEKIEILQARFQRKMTLEEIGSNLNISRERVRQFEQKALDKVNSYLLAFGFIEMLSEAVDNKVFISELDLFIHIRDMLFIELIKTNKISGLVYNKSIERVFIGSDEEYRTKYKEIFALDHIDKSSEKRKNNDLVRNRVREFISKESGKTTIHEVACTIGYTVEESLKLCKKMNDIVVFHNEIVRTKASFRIEPIKSVLLEERLLRIANSSGYVVPEEFFKVMELNRDFRKILRDNKIQDVDEMSYALTIWFDNVDLVGDRIIRKKMSF